MTWDDTDAAVDTAWNNEDTGASTNVNDEWDTGAGEGGVESNVSKHANDPEPTGDGDACRNCGETGHFARECPQPRKMTGECFNCGEVGHNKADCPNPRVARPFTGTCRICEKEGHPAAECPDKPAVVCRNCQKEGHLTSECTENRAMTAFYASVPQVDIEEAWKMLIKADQEKDLDDFRVALKAYARSYRTDFAELEISLREAHANVHLIGLKREISDTMTIVDLQGKIDREYAVGMYFSSRPRNAKTAERWPESPEENLERLRNAGFVMDRMIPKCNNCNQLGHVTKFCKEERMVRDDRVEVKCFNCNEVGHRVRNCPQERRDKFACRNCKQPGHVASDCPEPRSAEGVECKRCNETGHFAKDCPNREPQSRGCRNCGEEGHIAKECDKPRNPDTVTCRNCDKTGHFSRDCPEPKDWSRVKCSNCGEMGHTVKRCNQPVADAPDTAVNGNDTFDTNGDAGDTNGHADTWGGGDAAESYNDGNDWDNTGGW